ncbi:protein phosphatase 2C 37-like [Pyrus ussuriensis x Pyrus communis]|uniref:Protein phosphatase 2C 37-like n=1 Tax=Pyrus ussuriensis x Pyrus communis TaxID=2448454 RepID=A0A5N5GAY3_9ROSA|nr:protein phosphatase 2C 37-like [Pyrus ussuriensis x Pyrus communis]
MLRAIGDNYLKPYMISEPEVTVTDRAVEDECLILASNGFWDVVSNETACGVVRMCLLARSNKACFDASILLTKFSLARHSSDNISVVVVDLRRPGRLWSSCTLVQWFKFIPN